MDTDTDIDTDLEPDQDTDTDLDTDIDTDQPKRRGTDVGENQDTDQDTDEDEPTVPAPRRPHPLVKDGEAMVQGRQGGAFTAQPSTESRPQPEPTPKQEPGPHTIVHGVSHRQDRTRPERSPEPEPKKQETRAALWAEYKRLVPVDKRTLKWPVKKEDLVAFFANR